MLRSLITCFFILGLSSVACCQLNMSLVAHVSESLMDNDESADIWGYVDSNGIEYAIIGTQTAFRIYSLEVPAVPNERAVINGDFTDWRDMKSFGNYIYGVQDVNGDDGLLIVDMSAAPTTITHSFINPTYTVDGITEDLEQCHNLYIDEEGYIYLSGTNIASGGIIILDAFTTPGSPTFVGETDIRYSHDVYVRDSFMFTSEIYAGEFAVYSIADRTSPVLLATQSTGRNFTHNTWLSDDGQTLFTTDERTNAYVESYDISDLNNISRLDRWRPLATVGTNVIPHNVHVLNDYLVISHYSDGVIIVDAAQPDNLIEVGNYDTYTGSGTGFRGCWGAFPFLPSGLILASDINSGLYILDPTYIRACYLRGEVRDINTNATIPGVSVEILSPDLNEETTDNFGRYATGIATAGNYDVVYSHPSYPNDTVNLDLENGESIELTVFLGTYNGVCDPVKNLTGTLSTVAEFASQLITADGLIEQGTAVEMHANDSVSLDPGFQVDLGGQLYVDNVGCN